MRFIPMLAVLIPLIVLAAGNIPYTSENDDLQRSTRGVKKMSLDEGEKFFFDYWHLEHDEPSMQTNLTTQHAEDIQARSYPLQPALAVSPRLLRRDFKCPTGTSSCAAINRRDTCCSSGDTCVSVTDTGSGDVGCCPKGQSCSGMIGSCQAGYTSCSSELGGGCCIPGYECVSGGCAHVSTITITMHSTVMVSTTTYTTPAEPSTLVSSTTDSTGDLVPPARPTSLSTATTSHESKTSATNSVCPTGFYACSAVYQGGCCRTGRNCDTTSCPATSSTTLVSNDVTIVAPAATTTGHCASGWSSCAASAGGGCCPSGYVCGSSCTAMESGSATATVVKTQPESRASRMQLGMLGISIGLIGIWMT